MLRRGSGPVLALLLGVACTTTGGEQVAATDDTAALAALDDAPLARVSRTEPFDTPVAPEGGFPHADHDGVGCRTCHGTPPGHVAHDALDCGACHRVAGGTAAAEPTPAVGTRCASCHHANGRADCLRCHEGAPSASRRVAVPVASADRASTGMRLLPFDHPRHDDFTCMRCHTEGPLLPAAASCAGCHDRHHTATSSCAACHDASAGAAAVHASDRVHLGCGGAGCHTDPAVLALGGTRNLCLACHAAQAEHEPGGDCQTCHLTRIGAGGRP